MKKTILIAAILFLGISFNTIAQSAPPTTLEVGKKAPVMTFESTTVDYGTIEQNSNGKREFKFTNTGNAPLIIKNAQGSCGCTVPDWPKEPILPGQSSVIGVKYATSRLGPINKSITIYSNADGGTKMLKIKGLVNPVKSAPVNNAGPKS